MDENKYFLYGSGRDAATRSQRRRVFPREVAPRVGPYLVRPGRSYGPLTAAQLAGYERPIIEKVTAGSVQVLLRDRPLGLGDLRSLFASLRGSPEVVNYEGMSLAALHAFTRDHQQDAEAWYWLLTRLIESGDIAACLAVEEHMAKLGVEIDGERHEALKAAIEKARAAKAAPQESTTVPAGDVQLGSGEGGEPVVLGEKLQETIAETAEALASATEPVASETPEAVVEAPALAAEEPKAARSLPEGWKELSNKKLAELIKDVGAEMPSRTDKSSLIGALDAWLKG